MPLALVSGHERFNESLSKEPLERSQGIRDLNHSTNSSSQYFDRSFVQQIMRDTSAAVKLPVETGMDNEQQRFSGQDEYGREREEHSSMSHSFGGRSREARDRDGNFGASEASRRGSLEEEGGETTAPSWSDAPPRALRVPSAQPETTAARLTSSSTSPQGKPPLMPSPSARSSADFAPTKAEDAGRNRSVSASVASVLSSMLNDAQRSSKDASVSGGKEGSDRLANFRTSMGDLSTVTSIHGDASVMSSSMEEEVLSTLRKVTGRARQQG